MPTKFQQLVWNEIEKIPYGETRSYKDIAVLIGKPKSARAVANACAKNPILMAAAMKNAIRAGRDAFKAGRIEKKSFGQPSSPEHGLITDE